jgi:hypothetical protein
MTVVPWLRSETPWFVEAFENSKYWLPLELWLMIQDEIDRRDMIFDRKCEQIAINLNLDFDTVYYEDCTERIFNDPMDINTVCFFPPLNDRERSTLMVYGDIHLFSPARLERLINASLDGLNYRRY